MGASWYGMGRGSTARVTLQYEGERVVVKKQEVAALLYAQEQLGLLHRWVLIFFTISTSINRLCDTNYGGRGAEGGCEEVGEGRKGAVEKPSTPEGWHFFFKLFPR